LNSERVLSSLTAARYNVWLKMLTRLLKAKIHRATVTQTDVNYHGSITIDRDLLEATGLLPNEAVLIADCDNGNRFETYIIAGPAGSGVIGINGAAARLTQVGHKVIIIAFVLAERAELASHVARVALVDSQNRTVQVLEQRTLP
jgi:aspartate 1-decarboxylase